MDRSQRIFYALKSKLRNALHILFAIHVCTSEFVDMVNQRFAAKLLARVLIPSDHHVAFSSVGDFVAGITFWHHFVHVGMFKRDYSR
jgi:hypothetical protein